MGFMTIHLANNPVSQGGYSKPFVRPSAAGFASMGHVFEPAVVVKIPALTKRWREFWSSCLLRLIEALRYNKHVT
jgi:hypothetical protein